MRRRKFNDTAARVLEEILVEAENDRKASQSTKDSEQQIYDDIYSQLRSAGQSVDVAENQSKVWAAFWSTVSERYGDDALDLSRRFGVRIQGPAALKRGNAVILICN